MPLPHPQSDPVSESMLRKPSCSRRTTSIFPRCSWRVLFQPSFSDNLNALHCSQFAEILHCCPHVFMYVRSLEIRVPIATMLLSSSILPTLTLLTRVKLDLCFSKWQKFPGTFHRVCLSSMEDVCIKNTLSNPLSFFNELNKNLRRLTLTGCRWKNDESFPDPTKSDLSVSHKFQLESLSLQRFEKDALRGITTWVATCPFRSLEVAADCMMSFRYDLLSPLFACRSNSLTNLDLNLVQNCASYPSMC